MKEEASVSSLMMMDTKMILRRPDVLLIFARACHIRRWHGARMKKRMRAVYAGMRAGAASPAWPGLKHRRYSIAARESKQKYAEGVKEESW